MEFYLIRVREARNHENYRIYVSVTAMKTKILSLNIGGPAEMKWGEKSLVSSMLKHPVPGPLEVRRDGIEENSFANSNAHGNADSILYIYGMKSAREFAALLGLPD